MAIPSTLKPAEVAVALIGSAVLKHRTRVDMIFFKAFLAGVMLSFGGLLSEVLQGGASGLTASNPGIVKILGGFVFPVGLVMIVLQGQELLTSNMMIFPMALMKRAIPWWSLPLNWLVVTFGNLVGSLFFAAILVKYSGIISTAPYDTYVQTFAIHKAGDPEWHQIFLRGIGCNWLVSIAIWQATGARDTISKVWSSRISLVANMFSVPLGIMFHADLTTAQYIRKSVYAHLTVTQLADLFTYHCFPRRSLIAAYLGNIVGALFVALPAVYFYLHDYRADGLVEAEAGEVFPEKGDDVRDDITGSSVVRSDRLRMGQRND
ncbi:hypothetical protein EW146_g214 [Bondarzewia mesenterica]|uniref:Formate/nitrite transporter n=1 Tax=Bondarzewia mesenterica TaxID=1095465 RepID=A0A4S4M7M9_9AGAM|nr:hypothetical protein EW146_g214 [Bondarzewia mesenterica]